MGNICKRCSSEDLADEPLIRAIRKNSLNGVKKCLRSNNRGSATSALVEAALNANEVILNLLANAEDVNVRNSVGQTALLEVMASNRRSSVEALLKIGADPNQRHGRTGDTPLMFAIRNEFTDIVSVLLKSSADVNCLNNEMSSLMVACQLGFENIVRLLIESEKCDVELKNGQNENGLMFACASGKLGTVLFLISSGCNVNSVDANGMNALMKAASGGHIEIVKLLVKNNAQVSTADGSGRTAETHARMKGHSDIALYLAEILPVPHQNDVTKNGGVVNPYTKVESCGIEHVVGGDNAACNVEADGASTKEENLLGVLAISLGDTLGVLPPVEAADIKVPAIGATSNVKTVETQRDLKQIAVNIAEWSANGDPCGTTHESSGSTGCDSSSAMSTLTSTSGKCVTPTSVISDTPTSGICDTPTRCDTPAICGTPTTDICDRPIRYDTSSPCICETPTRYDTPTNSDISNSSLFNTPTINLNNITDSGIFDSSIAKLSGITDNGIFDTPTSKRNNNIDIGIFDNPTRKISDNTDSGIFDTPTSKINDNTDSGIFDTPTSKISNNTDSGIFDTPTSKISDNTDSGIFDNPSSKLSDIQTNVRAIGSLNATADTISSPHILGNRMLHPPLGEARSCEDNVEFLTPILEPPLDSKVTKNQQAKKIAVPMLIYPAKTFPRRKVPEWVKDEQLGNMTAPVDDREVNLNTPCDAHGPQSNSATHLVDSRPTSNQRKCRAKNRKQNKRHKCCQTIIITHVTTIKEATNVSVNGNDHDCCQNSSTESDQSSDENS